MYITAKDMEILGIDWENFCKVTGINEWCRAEGLADNNTQFEVTTEQFKMLQEKP